MVPKLRAAEDICRHNVALPTHPVLRISLSDGAEIMCSGRHL